jgi:hypothetical protein
MQRLIEVEQEEEEEDIKGLILRQGTASLSRGG